MTSNAAETDYVERMFDAFCQGDTAITRTCFTPDAVCWTNADELEKSVDDVCVVLEQFFSNSTNRTHEDHRVEVLGNIRFIRHYIVADLGTAHIRVPVMLRIELNDEGLITRMDEYLNPGAVNPSEAEWHSS